MSKGYYVRSAINGKEVYSEINTTLDDGDRVLIKVYGDAPSNKDSNQLVLDDLRKMKGKIDFSLVKGTQKFIQRKATIKGIEAVAEERGVYCVTMELVN